jgi:hypothetical protein
VKGIEACMKPDNEKDHHTNGYTNSQTGNIDKRVAPVANQSSEGGFKIAFKHKCWIELETTKGIPIVIIYDYQ